MPAPCEYLGALLSRLRSCFYVQTSIPPASQRGHRGIVPIRLPSILVSNHLEARSLAVRAVRIAPELLGVCVWDESAKLAAAREELQPGFVDDLRHRPREQRFPDFIPDRVKFVRQLPSPFRVSRPVRH